MYKKEIEKLTEQYFRHLDTNEHRDIRDLEELITFLTTELYELKEEIELAHAKINQL